MDRKVITISHEQNQKEMVEFGLLKAENERLREFHDAWVEHEISMATGNPDLVRTKRNALVQAHHAVLRHVSVQTDI